MDASSCVISCAASWTTRIVSRISASASPAPDALRSVTDDISSSDAEVCSSAAACDDEPSASCWLAPATWAAAESSCVAVAVRPPIRRVSGPAIERRRIQASARPAPSPATSRPACTQKLTR